MTSYHGHRPALARPEQRSRYPISSGQSGGREPYGGTVRGEMLHTPLPGAGPARLAPRLRRPRGPMGGWRGMARDAAGGPPRIEAISAVTLGTPGIARAVRLY